MPCQDNLSNTKADGSAKTITGLALAGLYGLLALLILYLMFRNPPPHNRVFNRCITRPLRLREFENRLVLPTVKTIIVGIAVLLWPLYFLVFFVSRFIR